MQLQLGPVPEGLPTHITGFVSGFMLPHCTPSGALNLAVSMATGITLMPFLVFSKLTGPHVGGMATLLAALEGLWVSAVPADMQGKLGVFPEGLETAILGALVWKWISVRLFMLP